MLAIFRLKNYGPFKDEMVFDMRAIKAYKEHSDNLIEKNSDNPLLKVVAIYGANASGKSSFVDAYNCYLNIVRNSFQMKDKEEFEPVLKKNYHPFLLDTDSKNMDIEFEGTFQEDNYEYKYGFIYNESCIQYEWLYRTSLSTNRKSVILERSPDYGIVLGASVKKTCEKYKDNIDKDVLALSFFGSLKLHSTVFKDTLYCITNILPISLSCDYKVNHMLNIYFQNEYDEQEKPRLLNFLKAIDTGIGDINVQKNDKKIEIFTYHIGRDFEMFPLKFKLESDGTKKAIAIYSLIRIAALYGKGVIIDEFNSQLHPLLQKYIINLFCEESTSGQLVYTTHDPTLLDKQFMRRDQIWFVSKNKSGEASIYALSDFKIRNDKSFGRGYLEGIYGGIPILKDFSFKEE